MSSYVVIGGSDDLCDDGLAIEDDIEAVTDVALLNNVIAVVVAALLQGIGNLDHFGRL